MENTITKPQTPVVGGNDEVSAFSKSTRVQRSPTRKTTNTTVPRGESSTRVNTMLTPAALGQRTDDRQTKAVEAMELAQKLDDFVQSKPNIHGEAKRLATQLRKLMAQVVTEQQKWQKLAETNEKKLEEERTKASLPMARLDTRGTDSPSGTKRTRGALETTSPTEQSARKVPKTGASSSTQWSKVVGKGATKTDRKPKNQVKQTEKPKRTENQKAKELKSSKAEALLVEVSEGSSHADIIRKLRQNESLKVLGEKVARIRRTQKGDMLIELQKGPNNKSESFKEILESALDVGTKVRALSHIVTVQVRDLDEITTAEELSEALKEQFQLGEEVKATNISMRNSFGGTQTAQFRLQAEDAKALMKVGRVKVGWTSNAMAIKAAQPVEVQRCYRCMGFGHHANKCEGEDRSKCCRKCGQEGHKAKSCENEAKCLLCTGEGGKHETGGRDCPAYKKAAATKKRT